MKHHANNNEGIVLETQRLLIKPLSVIQLTLYTKPGNSLEQSLGVTASERTLSRELKEAIEEVILPLAQTPGNNLLYCTLWTMIDKRSRQMVGDICFKGPPNSKGEIEIGYGTYTNFQTLGFMTEALKAICEWALSQAEIYAVLAETDKENIASHTTLRKNRFTIEKQIENKIWWRLEKENM